MKLLRAYAVAGLMFLFASPVFAKSDHDDPDMRLLEFRTAPLALIWRWYTIEGLVRLGPPSKRWAIGPSYIKYGAPTNSNMFFPAYRGSAMGFVVTRYFDVLSAPGWYGTFRYYFENYDSYLEDPYSTISHLRGHAVTLIAGYRFPVFDRSFLMAGVGLQARSYDKKEIRTDNMNRISPIEDSDFFEALPYLEVKVGVEF